MLMINLSIAICACYIGTEYPREYARSSKKTSCMLDALPIRHRRTSERHVVAQTGISLIQKTGSPRWSAKMQAAWSRHFEAGGTDELTGHKPTVSPAKNPILYFISMASNEPLVWRGHAKEAKR